MAEKVLDAVQDYRFLLAAWLGLFILTLIFTDLNMRSLFAAFCAWAGGIVTARIDARLRERKSRKEKTHGQY